MMLMIMISASSSTAAAAAIITTTTTTTLIKPNQPAQAVMPLTSVLQLLARHAAGTSTVVTEAFRDWLQSSQANVETVPQLVPLQQLSTAFPVSYSLITPPFYKTDANSVIKQ